MKLIIFLFLLVLVWPVIRTLLSILGIVPTGKRRGTRVSSGLNPGQRQDLFLRSLFAILAKMAKADGRIEKSEVDAVDQVFRRFGLSTERRSSCADVFNKAKDDARSVYAYAQDFVRSIPDPEVCAFVYEILWDVACADGWLHPAEKKMLEKLCDSLLISRSSFAYNYQRRRGSFREGDGYANYKPTPYEVLECPQTASESELRAAYRKLAKRYHPDVLRANGVPDGMIAAATKRMAEINAAWEEIRRARGWA